MSFARGTTDFINCDVARCPAYSDAGSMFHAETCSAAEEKARERGWSIGARHLCPKHAYLQKSDSNGEVND